ncbi:MAG: threonine synthase [Lactimicrobium sp.]|jgi:threonine synthase|uniref:threonine synthase n=1 Tax=Lactimicrobium sp. TaxID=2563780 RepID=UPI002F35B6A7
MKYVSTRNKNVTVSAHQAILKGLAADGGLYTPKDLNVHFKPEQFLHKSYQETAAMILSAFLDDYTEEEIKAAVQKAYDDKFDDKDIAPVRSLSYTNLLELYHGPTSAFKDLALTILPTLLTDAIRKENCQDTICILTATSGDTGKAALAGFKDVPGTAITVFYPEIGVSAIQKRQMQTSQGNNVNVIAVKGNFDDCQRMVKQASSSKDINACKGVSLSSANSINLGRLLPQIVYYCTAYARLVEHNKINCGEEINVSVPTGNFGDILAGWLAKAIGLPIHKLICTSNTNNVLYDFLKTGTYDSRRSFHNTMSPAMDILVSSNLERLLFLKSGEDDQLVKQLMTDLQSKGSYTVPKELLASIQQYMTGEWTNEEDCAKTIRNTWEQEHVLIDPHTAVALHGLQQYKKETQDNRPSLVLSTASAYKFSHDVYKAITGKEEEDDFKAMKDLNALTHCTIPANLANLESMPIRFHTVIEKEDGMNTIKHIMEELSDAHH